MPEYVHLGVKFAVYSGHIFEVEFDLLTSTSYNFNLIILIKSTRIIITFLFFFFSFQVLT